MPLVTQATYARHRGVSREAVRQRTVTAGGPIPVHGPRKLLDVAEADALWEATKSPAGASHGSGNGAAAPALGAQLAQARAAALIVDVQAKRLALEQRRGALISRDRATLKAFAFARMLRDRWLAWPSRVGALLAATFDLDAGAVTVVLEGYVREHLTELASECEARLFLGGSPARVHARPGRKVPAGAAVLVAVAEELRAALEAAGLLTLLVATEIRTLIAARLDNTLARLH
jgi:hypothetical protein